MRFHYGGKLFKKGDNKPTLLGALTRLIAEQPATMPALMRATTALPAADGIAALPPPKKKAPARPKKRPGDTSSRLRNVDVIA